MEKKLLGVIGGMGPLATVRFMERMIRHTVASKDQDHINMIVSNHATLPDRTASILNGTETNFLNEIQKDFDLMNRMKVSYIAIPCNTSHFFMPQYRQMTSIEIIDMVEETVREVKRRSFGKMIVFGTDGTAKTGIYQKKAEKIGLQTILPLPEEQDLCSHMIRMVKEGVQEETQTFDRMLKKYLNQNILPILACTELSCLDLSHENLDSMDVLVKRCIEKMGKSYTCKIQ